MAITVLELEGFDALRDIVEHGVPLAGALPEMAVFRLAGLAALLFSIFYTGLNLFLTQGRKARFPGLFTGGVELLLGFFAVFVRAHNHARERRKQHDGWDGNPGESFPSPGEFSNNCSCWISHERFR